MGLRD